MLATKELFLNRSDHRVTRPGNYGSGDEHDSYPQRVGALDAVLADLDFTGQMFDQYPENAIHQKEQEKENETPESGALVVKAQCVAMRASMEL